MDKKYKQVLNAIKKYGSIVILRHEMPDFDALGCQFGMKQWLQDNFKNKKIYALGLDHPIFTHKIYPETDKITKIEEPYLVLILDVANYERIEGREFINKAAMSIKIDHHILVENFGDIEIVKSNYSAACEILTEMIKSYKKYPLSKEAASYFYSGLVGDNGCFRYSSTSIKSFEMAAYLMESKIDIEDIYEKMFSKSIDDIKILKFLYNNYKMSEHGVIYTHISNKDLLELGIIRERVKAYVNLFSGYDESRIWVTFTEDDEKKLWSVSIRSRRIAINEVAARHNGGGHKNASGAKVKTYEETLKIVDELDDLLK